MKINIDKLQLKDIDEFWEVFSGILKSDFPGYTPVVVNYFLTRVYHKNAFSHWLTYNFRVVLIAKMPAIVGFVVMDKPYGGVVFLRWLGVLKEYRQQGIGRQLIEASIQEAINSGCHKIELAGQPGSERFYEKAGLVLEGIRKHSYFGIDQHIFGKVLGESKDEVMTRE